MNETSLPIIVLVPLLLGFVTLFLPNVLKYFFRALTLLVSLVALYLAVGIFRQGQISYNLPIFELNGFAFDMLLNSNALSAFMLLFTAIFAVLISLYSLKSTAVRKSPNIYYGSIMITLGASAGVLLSNHLLFLLIFWEIVAVSLYLMIATGGKESNFAATKTFAMVGASDAAFLLGLFIVWFTEKTFVISDISIATTSALPIIAFLLLMVSAITKAGAMPLHSWLPTSGEYAPVSVMALLPAAIDKLLGIYLLVVITRGMFQLNSAALSIILAIIGAATLIIAVMIAMVQHNLKKLLSYHAISQVGYMILGIATGTPVGIAGGVFHMLNNAIYKCCLFLCGGAVEQAAGTAQLDELGGLGKKMSITFTACLIAALSISGIPPLNGFVSKWMIYQGIIQMDIAKTGMAATLWPIWLTIAMFGSALTLASFVKLIHSLFLSRLPDKLRGVKEASPAMTVPMVVLAVLCIFFGIFYKVPLKMFIYPALGIRDGAIFGTWDSHLATALILVGIVLGLIILIVASLTKKARIVPTWTCGEIQPNDQMIIPGTHFYKTVSSLCGLKRLYANQEKGNFDLYNQGGKLGSALTGLLRSLHCGILPMYLTWVIVGLLVIIFVVCKIW